MGNKPSHSKSTRRSPAFDKRSSLKYASGPAFTTPAVFPAPPPYTSILDGTDEITSKHQTNYETHLNKRPSERQENVMKMLANYNTVFLVDDSLSMANAWDQARMALTELAVMATQHDTDGIDVYFMEEATKSGTNLRTASQVERLFNEVKPIGDYTPIGSRLEDLLLPYLAQIEAAQKDSREALKRIKPVNYIIITDGVPTDSPEDVIVVAAERLDKGHFPLSQVGVQFLQIGNSKEATEYLDSLDNQLAGDHGIRDMIDTTRFTGDLSGGFLIKCLLGGINRRVDRG